ncbi:head GIN domain-containing protein, partial [Demequina sp.]|uniref:head GIN domain-containing protein n=1 Tax=Demequina sp. TaxID=2050685 RepID=UPI0025B90F9E
MRLHTAFGALTLAAAALTLSACEINGEGPVLLPDDLSGETITQVRDLDGFTAISMGGSADLVVTEGESFEIEVTTDTNLQEHVTTAVEGNTLRIQQRYSIIGASPNVSVAVTVPDLTRLELSGAADVRVRSVMADSLDVEISGAGNVDLAADAQHLTISVSGAGVVTAHGTVGSGSIDVSGAGGVVGEDLTIADADVSVSGAGSVSVRVREALDASVSGAGSVVYFGDPTVTQDIS